MFCFLVLLTPETHPANPPGISTQITPAQNAHTPGHSKSIPVRNKLPSLSNQIIVRMGFTNRPLIVSDRKPAAATVVGRSFDGRVGQLRSSIRDAPRQRSPEDDDDDEGSQKKVLLGL